MASHTAEPPDSARKSRASGPRTCSCAWTDLPPMSGILNGALTLAAAPLVVAVAAPSAGVVMVFDPTGLFVPGPCADKPVCVAVCCVAAGLGFFPPKEKRLERLKPPDFGICAAPDGLVLAGPLTLSDFPIIGASKFAI